MVGFFRKMRQKLANKNHFVKYSRYAIGEIILVVIGILIALQINNSNQSRIERLELKGYLNSIAKNIESDIEKVEFINSKRTNLAKKTNYILNNLRFRVRNEDMNYDKNDVSNVSQTILEISELNYLNANLSGFESLKNSGYLSKLQGTDIEDLLYSYYNSVNEIRLAEDTYNSTIKNSNNQFISSDLEGKIPFFSPDWREWDENFIKYYQPRFMNILSHHSVFNLLRFPFHLIVKYENLRIVGKELIDMIKTEKFEFNESNVNKLNYIFDEYGDIGYPKVMVNGLLTDYYDVSGDSSNERGLIHREELETLEISFPKNDWGVCYFYNGNGSIEQIRTKDFSIYQKLKLELKGEKGGEKVKIGLKDETNPIDGSESKVELTLSNDWEFYEIPLESFEGTNLKNLFMVVEFVFENEPRKISVRHIEYMR
jgi:hypothetical protein